MELKLKGQDYLKVAKGFDHDYELRVDVGDGDVDVILFLKPQDVRDLLDYLHKIVHT